MGTAIFLDRDGVLCKEKNLFYSGSPLLNPENFEWEENSQEALKILSGLDFYLILVSNQSSIGKGILTEERFHEINKPIYEELKKNCKSFDGVYFCPHLNEDSCVCRKPSTGLIEIAMEYFDIDLENSFVVGDKTSDLQLGVNAGCKTVLVKTGYGGRDNLYGVKPDFTFENLYKFSKFLEKDI